MKKQLIRILILALGSYLVLTLSRDLFNLLKKGEGVKKVGEKVEELNLKNKELKEKLGYVQSDEFVEKEARDRLNMAKEDEVIVVLPEDFKPPIFQKSQSSGKELANWQKWMRLFFE